jgi:hypothetical protein
MADIQNPNGGYKKRIDAINAVQRMVLASVLVCLDHDQFQLAPHLLPGLPYRLVFIGTL